MIIQRSLGLLFGMLLIAWIPATYAQKEKSDKITPEQSAFFEKKIRPVLVDKCYSCHSDQEGNKVKGSLSLDTKEGLLEGGESGVVLVPGNPKKSLLISAIQHTHKDLKMPPKEKLPDSVISDFEKWVSMGAPDPRVDKTKVIAKKEIDIEKGREFWSFQLPKKSPIPNVKETNWAKSDIDRFVLKELESKNLKPVGDADKQILIRRVYFDLIGLPPTPQEVDSFIQDDSPKAFEKVVDHLLQSPHFGERWGRHWLDVARYAESSGRQVNINYPHAWRYRDYVIKSFNEDKPYNRFIQEQIAGDLLEAKTDKQKAELQIATGFLAIGPKAHDERNFNQFRMDVVDEQIDVMTQSILGLTVSCARCHDHKFDPIPMKDYYALAGILLSSENCYGTVRVFQNAQPSELISLPSGAEQPSALSKQSSQARTRLKKQIDDLKKERDQLSGPDRFGLKGIRFLIQIPTLESQLTSYDEEGNPKNFAMGIRERRFPANSKLYQRGEVNKPGENVPRGLVQVVSKNSPKIDRGSGRLQLADWLTSKENPLTSRVMVNRICHHLFGKAIVPTTDNFGLMGQPPSHPELLDYLAVSFQEKNYSIKKMIREIVLTRTYQLSSSHNEKNYQIDPDNDYLWRMSKRRLEAEPIRDAMLAISGQLETTPPIGSVVAKAGEGLSQILTRFGMNTNNNHRSVYLPVVRGSIPEALQLFDFAESTMVIGERTNTNVPSQALFLMNNSTVIGAAESFAGNLLSKSTSDVDKIKEAYRLCFAREPSAQEMKQAGSFMKSFAETQMKERRSLTESKKRAWAAFCQALFASAEFRYLN